VTPRDPEATAGVVDPLAANWEPAGRQPSSAFAVAANQASEKLTAPSNRIIMVCFLLRMSSHGPTFLGRFF